MPDAPTPLDLDAIALHPLGPGHPYGDAAYCGGCLAEREANQ